MRGGKREGAGRPQGSRMVKTALIAQMAAEAGETPLEFMLRIMRDESQPAALRFEAAKVSAPFIHPRLGMVYKVIGYNNSPENEEDLEELGAHEALRLATS